MFDSYFPNNKYSLKCKKKIDIYILFKYVQITIDNGKMQNVLMK